MAVNVPGIAVVTEQYCAQRSWRPILPATVHIISGMQYADLHEVYGLRLTYLLCT